MTESKTFLAALAELQPLLPVVLKQEAGQYGKYADLADVSREAFSVMGERGFSFTAYPTFIEGRYVMRGELGYAPTSEQRIGDFLITATDPQKIGAAMTYARRYLLGGLTGIVTDQDDDATSARPPAPRQPGTMAQRQPRASRKPEGEAGQGRRGGGDGEALAGRGAAPPPPGGRKPNPSDPWTDKQRGRLFALLGKAGVKDDRDERLAFCSRLLQLPEPLTTSNQLTYGQAGHLIDNLDRTGPRQSDQSIDDYVTLVLFGGNPYAELTEEEMAAEAEIQAAERDAAVGDGWEPEWP